jgi:hypothetical protein
MTTYTKVFQHSARGVSSSVGDAAASCDRSPRKLADENLLRAIVPGFAGAGVSGRACRWWKEERCQLGGAKSRNTPGGDWTNQCVYLPSTLD